MKTPFAFGLPSAGGCSAQYGRTGAGLEIPSGQRRRQFNPALFKHCETEQQKRYVFANNLFKGLAILVLQFEICDNILSDFKSGLSLAVICS